MVEETFSLKFINKGVHARVYSVENSAGMCCKISRTCYGKDHDAAEVAEDFQKEHQLLSICQSPYVIKVYPLKTLTFEGKVFQGLVMEKADFVLADYVCRLGVAEMLTVFINIAKALRFVHRVKDPDNERFLSHNDVKIENIVLCKHRAGGFTAKLIDFGLTSLAAANVCDWKSCTYAPPEVRDFLKFSSMSDIYMLGNLVMDYGKISRSLDLETFGKYRMCCFDPNMRATVNECITFFTNLQEHIAVKKG